MNQDGQNQASRRAFLKNTGRLAAASALAGVMVPRVHATESHTIHVVLIGCGGRGTGAAANALGTTSGPIKLVAMADVFENRLKGSHGQLKNLCGDKVDVPADRQFIGFDGYRKAMDCLKTGDVAIFATPPAFRWVHFGYAIQKGLNVFMEKPTTVDGPTTRKMLALAEESRKRNLKVGVGLMCAPFQDPPRGQGSHPVGPDRRGPRHAVVPYARAGGVLSNRPRSRPASAICCIRSSGSTASCGPAAAASATSTSTISTSAAG